MKPIELLIRFYNRFILCFEIFVLEILLKAFCNCNFSLTNILYTLAFSIISGMALECLTGLIRKMIPYRIVRGSISVLLCVPYITLYFVYCKFHVFYDINTILSGASDATGEFGTDISQLIFCFNGMLHIVLFLLPSLLVILLPVVLRKIEFQPFYHCHYRYYLKYITAGCLIFLISLVVIRLDSNAKRYLYEEHHFESAIEHFGLIPAVILDVKENTSPMKEELVFEMNETPVSDVTEAETSVSEESVTQTDTEETVLNTPEESNETQAQQTTPDDAVVHYEPHVLDIDFEGKAAAASNELASLDNYVMSLTPSLENEFTGLFKGKNLIFLTAEAFTAEVIDETLTPTLYRMATKGIQVTDYYQPASAGTTGGEYANLMGLLPTAGGKSMKNTADHYNYLTMGNLLNQLGYYGMAYHNNSYTFYDRHLTHINLGYSNGYMGKGNGMEEYLTSQWPASDLEMIQGTLPTYIDQQPFNIYYMTVSGHSLYTFKENAMARKHKEAVADLPYSDSVKAYYACQIELDSAMEYLISELEKKGIADDTVIVISTDHFPYGLDVGDDFSNLEEWYGTEINNNFERDHNRLIIWSGCLEKMDPIVVDKPTFSPDILPTLCNLFGIEYDSRLFVGRDILSDEPALVFSLGYDWKTEYGTYIASKGKFTPISEDVVLPDNYVKDINRIVKNKINYSKGVLNYDYYRHVFGED